MSRETILVVDDSEFILEFLSELLGKEGFTVLVAADGTEAMRMLGEKHVDLLLTDLNMPGVTGMELVKHAHEHHPDVISVIMTGYASLETARQAVVYGTLDYIFKPFKSSEIIAAIQDALERMRLRRENTRLREALALSNASQVIAGTTSRSNDLAQTIVMAALTLTRTRFGAMVLFDEDRSLFELRFSNAPDLGQPDACALGTTFQLESFQLASRGMFLVSVEDGHPLAGHVRNIALQNFSKMKCPLVVPIEQEALFLPLQAHGKLKGVLILSKEPGEPHFAASDLPLMSVIANLGATSIDNACLVATLEQTYVNTLVLLNIMLEARHPYTKGHTDRVVELSVAIGRQLGLSSSELQNLREATSLHDIGKFTINDAILNKPGSLTDEEMEIIRQHPAIGDSIISPMKFLQHCRPVVRHHHERWDGGGYPDGLNGEEIDLFARICTIADAVDAMASARTYRAPLSFSEIYDQLLVGSGTQFDENLVKITLGMIERGEVLNIDKPQKLVVG